MRPKNGRLNTAVRAGLIAFVVVWLLSNWLRARLPFWIPLLTLAALELEVVLRAWEERRGTVATARRERAGPGPEDADLGWGTVVEDADGVRWVPPPVRTPRVRRRALTAASIAAAIALVVVGLREDARRTWAALGPAEQTAAERRLQSEAATIAGQPVVLRCDEGYAFTGARSDALGVAFPRRRLAYLHPSICRALHDVLGGDVRERDATAEALVVLAHEAVHLRGERREGVTECLALQEGVGLGERLGIPSERAARMMRGRYLEALAERSVIRIEYQLPRSCVDGGSLDADRASTRFP